VLGTLRDAPRGADRRFRQDGHMLTCAPTGAGKGIGAVIPNLLDYPGSAFVLDLKGENYAVTARARRVGFNMVSHQLRAVQSERNPDRSVQHHRHGGVRPELAGYPQPRRSRCGQPRRRARRHADGH
jgi:hypothetical protein